jgi:[protein-PII] uridylyltransferase
VLTGGFSEVNRAQRVAIAQAEFAPRSRTGSREIDAYMARHYPAYWLKVDLPQKIAHAASCGIGGCGRSLATTVSFDPRAA